MMNYKKCNYYKMKRITNWNLLLAAFFFAVIPVYGQVEEEDEEEEDFSMYEDYGTDEVIKRFCGPKVRGLSPAKLVSVGYDFAGPHQIEAGGIGQTVPSSTERVNFYHGLRLSTNLPVLSNNKILINVGGVYGEARYSFENENLSNPLHQSLNDNIRTFGLNTTIFKPLNEVNYILGYYMAEYSGDYDFNNLQSLSFVKHTWLGVFGWKFNERYQLGFGATQSYRAGEVNYFPILMYNYTSENGKWGIESLLPARGHFRYRLNGRNLLFAGFDLEGTSYHLSNRNNTFPQNDEPSMLAIFENYDQSYNNQLLELRRSEIRAHVKYEKALSDFIWISGQVGYAINYRSDFDSGEFFRGFFRDIPYVQQNSVAGVPYVQFSINLVSP